MGIFNDNSQNNNTGESGQPGPPGQKGDPGIGFKLTADGNFDLDNKQMKNLSGGTDKSDAVNYGQLLEHTENNENSYHLQQSFSFFKNFGDQAAVPQSSQLTVAPNHNHHGLYYISKESSNNGFGGQAWVSLKMTNTLSAGFYTVVFETFAGLKNGNNINYLNNETLLQQVHGDSHISIINFNHDYQTTHSKAIIKFTTDGQSAEINFEIRYYGSSFNNSNLNMLFFSRVVKGSVGDNFNHDIFNENDVQLQNQTLYFEDINMNGNQIQNLAWPINDFDAVTKNYVDSENFIQDREIKDSASKAYVDDKFSKSLWTDGLNSMNADLDMSDHNVVFINTPSDVAKPAPRVVSNNYQKDRQTAVHKEYVETNYFRKNNGNLDMKNHAIKNIREFIEDDSSQAASDAQKYDVVNWGKIHEIRGDLKREINAVEYEALNRINPDPMEDDIDMANHKIINLSDPTNNQDVAHKKYVDDRIKAIPGGDTSDLLKLDGSRVMTGNLQMGDNFITGLEDPNPSDSDYATSVNYVNKTIDDKLKYSIQSSNTSNAFQYVMDDPAGQFYDEDDIKGIKKTNKDYHKINKETYEMQLLLDSRGYYSRRLGINMYILPNGEYSLVYELYYPNSIDSSTVQISAVSAVETVSKVTTNVFDNHTRSIIHLHKYNNVAPNRLMIDMVLKNKAGVSYGNK